jgi:hypothetical protein
LPTAPGLGIELDDEAVAAQIGEPRRYQGLYDPADGAAIDH